MIETCYNIDTSDNRIEVMQVELGAQLFLLVPPLVGEGKGYRETRYGLE